MLTWFILLRKVRTLSEWADALEAKCWMDGLVDWTRLDTPQTVMTTRAPAMLMNDFFRNATFMILSALTESINQNIHGFTLPNWLNLYDIEILKSMVNVSQ